MNRQKQLNYKVLYPIKLSKPNISLVHGDDVQGHDWAPIFFKVTPSKILSETNSTSNRMILVIQGLTNQLFFISKSIHFLIVGLQNILIRKSCNFSFLLTMISFQSSSGITLVLSLAGPAGWQCFQSPIKYICYKCNYFITIPTFRSAKLCPAFSLTLSR